MLIKVQKAQNLLESVLFDDFNLLRDTSYDSLARATNCTVCCIASSLPYISSELRDLDFSPLQKMIKIWLLSYFPASTFAKQLSIAKEVFFFIFIMLQIC